MSVTTVALGSEGGSALRLLGAEDALDPAWNFLGREEI